MLLTACADTPVLEPQPGGEAERGPMVQFAAGTTVSSLSTRAASDEGSTTTPGTTYYMPDAYRFVCRMYYKAVTGSEKYDVSGGTDITTWLKVSGNVGNSLYWRSSFLDNPAEYDTYGNDAEATCFFWQNRKEHAFLAWTDLNRATTIGYDPMQKGSLKFEPADVVYKKHTGLKQEQWVETGYEVYAEGIDNLEFTSWEQIRNYLETGTNYVDYIQGKLPEGIAADDFTGKKYYYDFGWSCKYSTVMSTTEILPDGTHRKEGWIQYQMFYDKLPYTGAHAGGDIVVKNDPQTGRAAFLFNNATSKYVAEIQVSNLDPTNETLWQYYLTDDYGNVRYDETAPRYTFYYKLLEEKRANQELVQKLPANEFDLTRGTRTSIAQQPDICQALIKQAPLGATQSANRVNLYFRHQFAQVQVNIKGSADLSVVIDRRHIQKVELLGVSEKAYVFTELNEDGNVEPTTYESVDISKYDDNHLKHNQYGTALSMFDMYDAGAGEDRNWGYPTGYLKSYNAIAFGQLQAIRITWNEQPDGSGIEHVSTYHVANDNLRNLRSGHKYVWNIELRRGTLAIVRTEIVDWIVKDELNFTTNGTITN